MTSEAGCWCCGELVVSRVPDPWDGRMDGYCEACSLNRCDCYADECPRSAPRVACATDDCSSRLHKELLEAEAHVTERIETLTAEVARLVVERDAAERALDTLYEIIHDYGSHNHPCPWSHGDVLSDCSCGFRDRMAEFTWTASATATTEGVASEDLKP